MAFATLEGNRFRIDGEIAENHAILVDHFYFDGEYRPFGKDKYTRRQINLYRMFFADFLVNSQQILMQFCKEYFRVTR